MNKNNLTLIGLLFCGLLSACSSNTHDDLDQWMKETTTKQKGQIKPLPDTKSFIPTPFVAKSDPFKDKPVISLNNEQNKYAPNPDRRKEPLEAYTLESLKMTGSLIKDKMVYAMILAPDGTINYVTKGNYLGTNYGKIVSLDENQLVLDERVKNSSDEWEPKKTIIQLDDSGAPNK